MKLKDIYKEKDFQDRGIFKWVKPVISYEVFPPKDDTLQEDLLVQELEKLNEYSPAFVSLTCGAGGKSNNSFPMLNKIKENLNVNIMPHFTCICNDKENIHQNLMAIKKLGIENILALRGDEPKEINKCYYDFCHANELVEFIKSETNLSIGVAGYPEGHIDSFDVFADIENLKKKVDAGADVIITQLFFNNDKFFSYVQLVRDAGINIPIVAGVMPIVSYKQVQKMIGMANISIPKTLEDKIERYKNNSADMKEFGIDFASYQCQQMIDAEVAGLHFFTLNKAYSTSRILENIL